MDAPCRFCKDRYLGCHSECSQYNAYLLAKHKETAFLNNNDSEFRMTNPMARIKNTVNPRRIKLKGV